MAKKAALGVVEELLDGSFNLNSLSYDKRIPA